MNSSISASTPIFHIAFYKFARLDHVKAVKAVVLELASSLLGNILLAKEGINGTLAGSADDLDCFERALRSDDRLQGAFSDIIFKRSACKTLPFARLKVHHKSQIVFMGVNDVDAVHIKGIDVSPQDWRELIAQDDVVVIDNRNSFEYQLGRFKHAVDHPDLQRLFASQLSTPA